MNSNAMDCLLCEALDSSIHSCPARVVVIDPVLFRADWQDWSMRSPATCWTGPRDKPRPCLPVVG